MGQGHRRMSRQYDEMMEWWRELTSWWNSVRSWIAFAVAPLAIPVVLGWVARLDGASRDESALIVTISLIVSYLATFLIGLPLYLLLRAYRLTSFWLAPVVGGIVGGILNITVVSKMIFNFDFNIATLPGSFLIGALEGASVGTILWLIARPDRVSRRMSSEERN
jgi:hypothetical protein